MLMWNRRKKSSSERYIYKECISAVCILSESFADYMALSLIGEQICDFATCDFCILNN